MPSLTEVLATLEESGRPIEVVRGTPAKESEILALGKRLGQPLPLDYAAFLREYGALWLRAPALAASQHMPSEYGNLRLVGTAPGVPEIDTETQVAEIAIECGHWAVTPPSLLPVLLVGTPHPRGAGSGSGYVLDGAGACCDFHRGTVDPREDTFEQIAVDAIATQSRYLRDVLARDTAVAAFFEQLVALVPQARSAEAGARDSRLVLHRRSDGVAIEVRAGDGREYGGRHSAVFVSWFDPASRTLAEMNEQNRQAWLVRGSVEKAGCRYRGRLALDGLDPALLLAAIVHDAGLALDAPPPAPPRIEDVQTAIDREGPLLSPAARLLAALSAPPREAASVLRDGVLEIASSGRRGSPRLLLRMRVAGWCGVVVEHRGPWGGSHEDGLRAVNAHNASDPKDVNHDLEGCVRAFLDDANELCVSLVTTLGAIAGRAWPHEASELDRAARLLLAPT
jgi:hypothetical protein